MEAQSCKDSLVIKSEVESVAKLLRNII